MICVHVFSFRVNTIINSKRQFLNTQSREIRRSAGKRPWTPITARHRLAAKPRLHAVVLKDGIRRLMLWHLTASPVSL